MSEIRDATTGRFAPRRRAAEQPGAYVRPVRPVIIITKGRQRLDPGFLVVAAFRAWFC